MISSPSKVDCVALTSALSTVLLLLVHLHHLLVIHREEKKMTGECSAGGPEQWANPVHPVQAPPGKLSQVQTSEKENEQPVSYESRPQRSGGIQSSAINCKPGCVGQPSCETCAKFLVTQVILFCTLPWPTASTQLDKDG